MWREKSRCNSSSDFFPCRPQRDAARETDKRIAHTARDTQLSVRHGRKNMVRQILGIAKLKSKQESCFLVAHAPERVCD